MLLKIISFLNFSFFLSIPFIFSSCDKPILVDETKSNPSHKTQPIQASVEYPKDVLDNINITADKFFINSNQAAKKAWIDKQLHAYDSINAIVPDIPLNDFAAIKSFAVKNSNGDWTESYRNIIAQIDAYKNIQQIKLSTPKNVFDFSSEIARNIYPNDFIFQANEISKWESLFNSICASSSLFSQQELERIKQHVISISKNGNIAASPWFARQQIAKRYIKNIIANADESLKKNFAKIESNFPANFEKQLELLKVAKSAINSNSNADGIFADQSSDSAKSSEPEEVNDTPLAIDNKTRFSIFTRRDIDGQISTAVLVKLNGKNVILCNKDFFSGNPPFSVENSLGKITCSRAFISRDFPLIMLMPDSIPATFSPIEVISAKESPSLIDKKICMIAPLGAGLKEIPVKIFSEDQKYLNLTSDTAPRIAKDIDIKKLDRAGNKLLVSTTISIEAGNNSIVIDPNSGKLVSMAFRKYNPGVLSWTGKTGSIVGHEKSAIPDSDTFIRQFDGTAKKIEAPDSSIAFIRMTSLDDWLPLNADSLQKQKTTLRKFTDDNNDFLMFFKRNLFGDMLRSRRLGTIAERYRKRFISERMDRITYERHYKNYMLDVMYAMRREITQMPNADSFYAIYRDEMEYQIALRKSMHDYLADIIKHSDLINVIHSDLRVRYTDPMKLDNGAALPSPLGGSIGGGF